MKDLLITLRQKAITKGTPILNADEVLEEIRNRRAGKGEEEMSSLIEQLQEDPIPEHAIMKGLEIVTRLSKQIETITRAVLDEHGVLVSHRELNSLINALLDSCLDESDLELMEKAIRSLESLENRKEVR